jgi:hypothetical protein
MGKGKWATLKLHQLRLDQENYRIGQQKTQRDAIRAMIADQGNKLVRLAKDILQMEGVSPGEPIWVIPSGVRGQYIVEEGNRRITALKLMENPALADETSVSKQFRRLGRIYAENPIRELEARVFESRDDVLPWKRRRHMTSGSGVGLAAWKPMAKGRANRDIGEAAPRSLAVLELLSDDRNPTWNEIAEALDSRWTTVDRILNAAAFKDILGINIDPKTGIIDFQNGDAKAGQSLLMRILSAMAAPEFEFREIEDAGDRARFIGRFSEWSVCGPRPEISEPQDESAGKPADGTISPGWTNDAAPPGDAAPSGGALPSDASASVSKDESGESQSRRAQADAARLTLAPNQGPRVLSVRGLRLAPLYAECRKIKVRSNENAAALLLRVFIELSSEALLQEKQVTIPDSLKRKHITKWDDYKVKLSDKIMAVSFFLDPSQAGKEFKQARVSAHREATGPYSISTLHAYFHNLHFLPDAASIKDTWDGWETYLREVHTALGAD